MGKSAGQILYGIHYIAHTICHTVNAMPTEIYENLRLELRRGCLILAVLAELRTERYGYTLRKSLEEQGTAIDESTLYPLLRRLESQGLLVSEWREEDRRQKRFYRLSPDGRELLGQLMTEWQTINASISRIVAAKHP